MATINLETAQDAAIRLDEADRVRFAAWFAAWHRLITPVSKPMSPGAALDGWQMSPEDANTVRRVLDPKSPAGKPKLRAGRAASVAFGSVKGPTTNGINLIAVERDRQLNEEGWTAEHDDTHTDGQMALAAACYAVPESYPTGHLGRFGLLWPFDQEWWKPSPENRVRELAKAGALIAAEIDRLLRLPPSPPEFARLCERCQGTVVNHEPDCPAQHQG